MIYGQDALVKKETLPVEKKETVIPAPLLTPFFIEELFSPYYIEQYNRAGRKILSPTPTYPALPIDINNFFKKN